MELKILHVVGARPNFMKAAPVVEALRHRSGISNMVVHTGQHYDASMKHQFFEQLLNKLLIIKLFLSIDHLLLSPRAADRLNACDIDRHVRGWERPSDHVPVWVELRH